MIEADTGDTTTDRRVRLGITGVGKRGQALLEQCTAMNDVWIPAVCDIQERRLDSAEETLENAGRPTPERYTDHEAMVANADIDGVIIAPPWRFHIPMAIQAMEAGVTPGLDVGPANTVEECWNLVRTAEETSSHCMLLENDCFTRPWMALLNMVREGLFGELVHCEGGYCHDLRGRFNSIAGTSREDIAFEISGDRYFRGVQHEKRNANLYPSHSVGPMAKILEINHGNRFVSLASFASKSRGLADWAEKNLEPDHPSRGIDWAHGDIITTVIKCANGETMTVIHDVNLPRPDNSRRFNVRGTNAIWHNDLDSIYVDDRSPDHEWEEFEKYRNEFEHDLWKKYLEQGVKESHGGIDYLALRSFIESVVQDKRPPIDVYDTATWMAISPLSEESIATGSDSVAFPDFTNGSWMVEEPIFGETSVDGGDRLDLQTILAAPETTK